LNKKKLHY